MDNGGEGGIRTHGTLPGTTVFETVPFDHSGTSPKDCSQRTPSGRAVASLPPRGGRDRGRGAMDRTTLSARWLSSTGGSAEPLATPARRRIVAERVGFEPTVGFPLHTLSKRAP